MSKNELQKIWDCGVDLPYKDKVELLQQALIENIEDVETNEKGKKVLYPSWTKYNHYFSDGLYVREMFCPKNYLCFTVIHNTANPLFMMKGTMWVTSEEGVEELVAPTFIFTKPGTKRICYFAEDTVCVTVHPNPDGLTDLDEIEKKMFSCDWNEYDETLKKDVWSMVKHKDYFKNKNYKKMNKINTKS
mgnify:CR=1 FL=1